MSKLLLFSLSIVFSLLLTGSTAFAATSEKSTSQQRNAKKSDFGVKSIDPFQKVEEKKEIINKAPNPFLDILREKVVIPDKKKRPTRKPASSTKSPQQKAAEILERQKNEYNPFEDGVDAPSNPFEDGADDKLGSSSNPFAAGDPFAYEYVNKKGKP